MICCKFREFDLVLSALGKRCYLLWFRALEENHTICDNLSCLGGLLAGCCVDGLSWLGWVGWVELAGFAGGLFGCLPTCSTFCMAVFLSGAASIRQSLLASLSQCSALDSHRFPETCLQPARHWANLLDKLCLCLTLAAQWQAFACKQFYTSAVGTSMAKQISYAPCNHWDTKSKRQECNNPLVSTPGRGFTGIYIYIYLYVKRDVYHTSNNNDNSRNIHIRVCFYRISLSLYICTHH